MTYSQEITKIFKLSVPLFIAQFAQTAMGFVDTIMAGGVSANDMAAVSIATSLWLPSILFGVGVLMALLPLIAQAHGANNSQEIIKIGQQGLYLSLLLAIPILFVLYNAGYAVQLLKIDPSLQDITTGYLHIILFAVPPFLLFQALRNYVEGLSYTKPAMVISFIGLLANIPLNWVFVYGKLGFPAMGGVGCGLATVIVYWIMFFSLFLYVLYTRKLKHYFLFTALFKPDFKQLWAIFKLGLPVAIAIFFEVTIFACVAILISPLGALIVAAHQIAINFSSMIYMLPLSISHAVSIRVGFNLGRSSNQGAKNACNAGFSIGVLLTILTASLTIIFRESIILLYTDNSEVMTLATTLVLFSALYQGVDAIQVIAGGALRGYKQMNAIFKRTFIAYWLVGLPVGYILGMTNLITAPLGASGFWIGITIGLATSAILLGQHLFKVQRKSLLTHAVNG